MDVLCLLLMRNFRLKHFTDLYFVTLDVVHRLIVYQKKHKIRLGYPWTNLWTPLFQTCAFISTHQSKISPDRVVVLAEMVVKIISLFILYGDDFLHDAASYYQFFYEFLRAHDVLVAFEKTVLDSAEGLKSASIAKLDFSPIHGIFAHFGSKLSAQELSYDNIITVIRDNMDDLSLKHPTGLEAIQKFNENPVQVPFFRSLLRQLIQAERAIVMEEIMKPPAADTVTATRE